MSFTNIHLPDFVLVEMFKTSIVGSPTEIKQNESPISFLGDNKKNVTILLQDEDAVFIHDERLKFLNNILQACRLTLADVAIINIQSQPAVQYQSIVKQLHPKFILLFDVNAAAIGFPANSSLYQLQNINDCVMMSAASLDAMLANNQEAKVEKSKLWTALKTMFII
jgi:hypothetical protein